MASGDCPQPLLAVVSGDSLQKLAAVSVGADLRGAWPMAEMCGLR